MIKVELTPESLPQPPVAVLPPPDPAVPPPLFAPAAPPQAQQLVPVAQPSPAVAFALPIEAPARIVELKQASFVRPVVQPVAPVTAPVSVPQPAARPTTAPPAPATAPVGTGTAPVPAVESITFGRGEGDQPKPGYPRSAQKAGQEGTVVVRFSVGTNGVVMAAEVSVPSPWSLLNNEAVRVVREQWRFKDGPVRLYEVAIQFALKK